MSYPNWWWWFSSHHNDHNQGRERGTGRNKKHVDKKPSNNENDGHQLVRRGGNCTHVKDSVGRDSNKGSSCIYCWRNLSEGAKKPTYSELFAFENNRQQSQSHKRSSGPELFPGSPFTEHKKYFGRPFLIWTFTFVQSRQLSAEYVSMLMCL